MSDERTLTERLRERFQNTDLLDNPSVEPIRERTEAQILLDLAALEQERKRRDELLFDCWWQFAYKSDDGSRWDGGLSTLEDLIEHLMREEWIDANGRLLASREAKLEAEREARVRALDTKGRA